MKSLQISRYLVSVSKAIASLEQAEGTIWRVRMVVGARKCVPSCRGYLGVATPWNILKIFLIETPASDAFLVPKMVTASVFIEIPKHWENEDCWGGCQMRPKGPIIEVEGRAMVGFLGRWQQAPSTPARESVGSPWAPVGFRAEPQPPKGLPLF